MNLSQVTLPLLVWDLFVCFFFERTTHLTRDKKIEHAKRGFSVDDPGK